MTVQPTTALLVPCRNGARYLPRLLESARTQVRPFDEILLFDDGSTDGSGEQATRLGARVIRSDRALGAAAARNRLLEATGCAWVHFHDVDDALAPGFLAAMLARADDRADVVLCQVDWFDEVTGQKCSEWRYREEDYAAQPIVSLIHNTVGGIGGLYRRELLQRVGGFDEHLVFWEDTDLHIRLARAGARLAVVDEVLALAYRRPDSLSNRQLGRVWRDKTELLARLLPAADPAVVRAVAEDAERIARRQLRRGDLAGMTRSLAVCRQAGGRPPASGNKALCWIGRYLSSTGALVLQEWARVLAMSRSPRSR